MRPKVDQRAGQFSLPHHFVANFCFVWLYQRCFYLNTNLFTHFYNFSIIVLLLYSIRVSWNALPEKVRHETGPNCFKIKLNTFFFGLAFNCQLFRLFRHFATKHHFRLFYLFFIITLRLINRTSSCCRRSRNNYWWWWQCCCCWWCWYYAFFVKKIGLSRTHTRVVCYHGIACCLATTKIAIKHSISHSTDLCG